MAIRAVSAPQETTESSKSGILCREHTLHDIYLPLPGFCSTGGHGNLHNDIFSIYVVAEVSGNFDVNPA